MKCTNDSSMCVGRVRARSPIRTPARKSVVGSPRAKTSLPPIEHVEMVKKIVGSTYADQMTFIRSKISSDHAPPKPDGVVSPKRSPKKYPPSRVGSQGLEGSRYV